MGNPYPAEFEAGGVDKLVGEITFSDPGNQPGGGGGGPVQMATLEVTPLNLGAIFLTAPGNLVGGVSPSGLIAATASAAPVTSGVDSNLLDLRNQVNLVVQGAVASTTDPVDVGINLLVTDPDGTNIADYVASQPIAQPVTDLAFVFDFSAANWNIDAGTDLTNTAGQLKTTAGGTFFLTAIVRIAFD